MQKLFNILRENVDRVFYAFGAIVILSVIGIQFFMLNRTLIVSDEGYYLCLLRDVANAGNSRYQFLCQSLYTGDIYQVRLLVWILTQLSMLIFAFGCGDFVRKICTFNKPWIPYVIAIISVYVGCMYITACPSPNYITLNMVVAAFSIGSLLFGLSRNWRLAYILSGFFLAALFPVMITNLVLFPLICFVIAIVGDNRWRSLGYWMLGFGLFFCFYFLCCETPSSLMAYIQSKTSESMANPTTDYGILFWIKWIGESVLYWIKMFLMAGSCYLLYQGVQKTSWKKPYKLATIVCGVLLILLYYWHYLMPVYAFRVARSVVWTKDLYWIVFFIILIDGLSAHRLQNVKSNIVGLLLAITPICLCFGTDVSMITRQGQYWMFLIPVLTLFLGELSIRKKYMLLAVFGINLLVFWFSMFSVNWNSESYLKSNVSVKTIGIEQNIKLEKDYVDRLDACQRLIPRGEQVLASNACWGFVVLLDYAPISYNYCINSMNVETNPENLPELKAVEQCVQELGYCWVMTADWEPELQQSVRELKDYSIKEYSDGLEYKYFYLTNNE